MPSAYKTAVERAAAALAVSVVDPSGGEAASDALIAALRVFVGDDAAATFPPRRSSACSVTSCCFGDTFGEQLRGDVERNFGTDAAEVLDREIVKGIAAMIRRARGQSTHIRPSASSVPNINGRLTSCRPPSRLRRICSIALRRWSGLLLIRRG